MPHKPKIFIGSSGAGFPVVEKVKTHLAGVAEVITWRDEDIWEPNTSTFDNLLRMLSYFDYGFFVATGDDATLSKEDKVVLEPRDNVILEMALFTGAMGKYKSFMIVEDGIKMPTDFNGIFMSRFTRKDDQTIAKAVERCVKQIVDHEESSTLGLYPTTALAVGYFKNFVKGLSDSIFNQPHLEFNGTQFTDFKVRIVIPRDLTGTMREKADIFYKKHKLVENTLQTQFRKHPAWFHLDPHKAPSATLYDMPSTLNGLNDAIEMSLQQNFYGRSKVQEVIEQRELKNFRKTLQYLISESDYAKECVELVGEDVVI